MSGFHSKESNFLNMLKSTQRIIQVGNLCERRKNKKTKRKQSIVGFAFGVRSLNLTFVTDFIFSPYCVIILMLSLSLPKRNFKETTLCILSNASLMLRKYSRVEEQLQMLSCRCNSVTFW